jgi:hypothetical protein
LVAHFNGVLVRSQSRSGIVMKKIANRRQIDAEDDGRVNSWRFRIEDISPRKPVDEPRDETQEESLEACFRFLASAASTTSSAMLVA